MPVMALDTPVLTWKDPDTGKIVKTVDINRQIALYVEPGHLTGENLSYDSYAVYVYRYEPITGTYEPYDINTNGFNPVMLSLMDAEQDAVPNAAYLTFTEPGTYQANLWITDSSAVYDPVLLLTSEVITANKNWLTLDSNADSAGGIFGLDGEAVKLILGMLIVLACAVVPPLVFENTHPMVILLCGGAGLVASLALGLIPLWILFILGIAAITMVVLNVRGGQTPPGGNYE